MSAPLEVAALPDYEVRVTLTVAIPVNGAHPHGLMGYADQVLAAMRGHKGLPDGSCLHGDCVVRVRSAKEIRADTKREEAKARREGR